MVMKKDKMKKIMKKSVWIIGFIYDEVNQRDNVEEEKLDEEKTNDEEAVNKMYNDVNNTHVLIIVVTPEVKQQVFCISSFIFHEMIYPNPDTSIDSILNLNIKSTSLVDVPVTTNDEIPPSSFEDRVKALEDDFSEFKQTNLFAKAVSLIPDRLRSKSQAKNENFINKINENMKKIIKEQVKVQVKEQVSKILPRIEKSVNEQLKAEVLIRSSNEAKTSHAVAANLSELELKKILIDKMENKKSIDRSVQQKNLYTSLVDAYESNKDILATYGDTVILKRHQDDEDEDEEPSTGSNRRSKRRRAGKEPESTSAPKEKTSKSIGKSKEGSKSHQAEEPTHNVEDLEELAHQEFDIGFTDDQPVDVTTYNLAQKEDPRELMDTPLDFSVFVLNRLKVDTLTPELLAGPTFELMKVSIVCDKHALWGISHWGRKRQQFYGYAVNRESTRDVYSRNRIIRIKKLTIVEWHNYKHLEWITIRTDDDKLYTFKEGVSLRMFTRSTVIRRQVEDLQLGIKSYQKKLNIINPDMYRSDLKRKTPYTAYSNPKGFIY
ncbi:hypothetical protein Tco_0955687 [Tanacetum coccineum]|uniref:Uncharacterized protein n=1 Tax=Tanacetum coccineum TaxID=301880 RepID=A0ABQ5E7Y4_9ASTR